MNKIQELEQSLEKAKKEQYLGNRLNELEAIKREYEGKCFASNLFSRFAKTRWFSAKYYEKFYIKEGEIFVLEWTVTSTKHPAFYKSETSTYDMTSHIYERKLSGDNEYNVSYNLDSGYSFHRKEITLGQFMSLWRATKECHLVIRDAFKSYPELEIEDIRQGEHHDDLSIEKIVLELNMDIIDLKKYPKLFGMFEYKRNIPMLQNGRWLPRVYAKQILEYIIADLTKEINDPWATIGTISYNKEKISNIQEFITSNL